MNTELQLNWQVSPIDINYDYGTNQLFKIPLGAVVIADIPEIKIASETNLGVIKVGDYLKIRSDGKLDVSFYTDILPTVITFNSESTVVWENHQANLNPFNPISNGDYSHININGVEVEGYSFSLAYVKNSRVQVSIPVGADGFSLINIFSSITTSIGEVNVPPVSQVSSLYNYSGVAVGDRTINLVVSFNEDSISLISNIDSLSYYFDTTGITEDLYVTFAFTLNNGIIDHDVEELFWCSIMDLENYPVEVSYQRVSNLPPEIEVPLNDLTYRTNGLLSSVSEIYSELGQKADAASVIQSLSTKADLENGVVPASQLPSYIDDVLNGTYVSETVFNNEDGAPYTPESGKIYIDVVTNKTHRWSGSAYVVISDSLALGETASTAYRGDRGKATYDHSISQGNPHNATTSDIPEGTKLYFNEDRVRQTTLNGLVTNSDTPVVVSDTLLQAIGKLQAQNKFNWIHSASFPGFSTSLSLYENNLFFAIKDGMLWVSGRLQTSMLSSLSSITPNIPLFTLNNRRVMGFSTVNPLLVQGRIPVTIQEPRDQGYRMVVRAITDLFVKTTGTDGVNLSFVPNIASVIQGDLGIIVTMSSTPVGLLI